MLSGRTEDSSHFVRVVYLALIANVPLHKLPSLFSVLASVDHRDSTDTGNRVKSDVTVSVLDTGQRIEGPKSLDLGCEYLEVIVRSCIVTESDRHLSGSETVCKVVLIGEGVHSVHRTHVLERCKSEVRIEVDSHTAVSEELSTHLIYKDVTIADHRDLHVLSLENRDRLLNIVPGLRNLELKLCKDILADEHHREALCFRKTVATLNAVRVLHLKNDHRRLIEVGGHLVEVLHIFNRFKCTSDRVVDYVTRADTEVYVRTLLSKDRRKERTARNETEVDGYAVFLSELIINEVSDNLRLISTGCDPYLYAVLCDLIGKSAHTVVVTEEGLNKSGDLVPKRCEEACLSLGELFIRALNYEVVKSKRLSLCVSEPGTE